MTDSFMHNHQSALDSFMEDKAIQDLEDAGIYPVPDNDAILENLYEESFEELSKSNPDFSSDILKDMATRMAQIKFEHLPEPGDYDD